MVQHLPTAFGVALIIFIGGLAALVLRQNFEIGDLPSGWATTAGAIIQVVAVYLAARMGFRAQSHHAALARIENAKSVAAPIRAELIYIEGEIRSKTTEVYWNLHLNPPTPPDNEYGGDGGRYPSIFPKISVDLYEAQRQRLGDLGSFLAYIISQLYLDIRKERTGVGFHAQDWLEELDRLEIEKGAFVDRIRDIVELLQALEATGSINEKALRNYVKDHPTSWEPLIGGKIGHADLEEVGGQDERLLN